MNSRKFLLILIDGVIVLFANASMALLAETGVQSILVNGQFTVAKILAMVVAIVVCRSAMRLYGCIWRYANVRQYLKLILADAVGTALVLLVCREIPGMYLGFSYTVLVSLVTLVLTLITRFLYQAAYAYLGKTRDKGSVKKTAEKLLFNFSEKKNLNQINVAIVGAGNVGAALADTLKRNPKSHYNPFCFVDKDKRKIGNTIDGLYVYEASEATIEKLKRLPIQEIIIAIPDVCTEEKEKLYDFYSQTGLKVKLYDYLSDSDQGTMREFQIEDLLFRDTISIQKPELQEAYRDRTILVTGGGGSIGSELCRQIAKCQPKKLIILDIYENNIYEIQQELRRKYADSLNMEVVIASVRDAIRMEMVFSTYRPDVVFHAAAHKHVPLMEDSPSEAIKNNVFGTYHTANLAEKYGVKKFILISTDKAVNPTNVMGASKRLCEMVVQCRQDSRTEFAAVRFGNVLGSNGSVIPLFRRQIAEGGPVTLTDKRIIRYFMTIPEAVSLVMETGMLAHSGELFVLDMGKPIKILELAEKMIRLSGLTPYEDIDIVEVGLRPGEKLYEELLMKPEELNSTENGLIFVERETPPTREAVEEKLQRLRSCLDTTNEAVIQAIRETVPTYCLPEEVNASAEQAKEMQLMQ